jgi:IclR family acetate operon transcriptional repressor
MGLSLAQTMSDRRQTVTTTQLSLDILETVFQLDGARLRDIIDELDIAKSTAHRHLTTLLENGYLVKTDDVYDIGLKFLNFGEYARSRWPGIQLIEEAVSELTERTNEECDFVAPDRGLILTIAESYHKWVKYGSGTDDNSSKQYRARIGSYYHMHATASGLAILATYSRERVEAVIDRRGLPVQTKHTITTREGLFEELARIRERGYAIDDQGYTEGMRSVGKAVHGPSGAVIGALSVSGPTYRVDGEVLEREIPNALVAVVETLEEQLES